MQADGRTDMNKLIVAFHNFANAPKKAMNRSISFFPTATFEQPARKNLGGRKSPDFMVLYCRLPKMRRTA